MASVEGGLDQRMHRVGGRPGTKVARQEGAGKYESPCPFGVWWHADREHDVILDSARRQHVSHQPAPVPRQDVWSQTIRPPSRRYCRFHHSSRRLVVERMEQGCQFVCPLLMSRPWTAGLVRGVAGVRNCAWNEPVLHDVALAAPRGEFVEQCQRTTCWNRVEPHHMVVRTTCGNHACSHPGSRLERLGSLAR